jgi:hypothetical protein
MPEPEKNETKDKYIGRCVSQLMKDEGKEQDQALAICYSYWKKAHPGSEDKPKKEDYEFRKPSGLLKDDDSPVVKESTKVRLDTEGSNQTVVTIGDYDFYFSYKTIVAVRIAGDLYCTDERFSNTTAKYLNKIEPDKTRRMDSASFDKLIGSIKVTALKP